MPTFISDEEMMQIEPKAQKTFISDDEMAGLETQDPNAFMRGAIQGASFGLRDEGAGLLKSPLGAAKEVANKFGYNFSDDDVAAYRAERDASRMLDKQAREASPYEYMGGQVAGGIGTAIIPGLGLAKGASALKAAAQGAGLGGLAGLGSSEAQGLGGLAADTAIGAGLGGATSGAIQGVTNRLSQNLANQAPKVADKLDDVAEQFAVKSTGATGKQTEKFAPDAGRQLLDRGLIKFGQTPEDLAASLGQQMEDAGTGIRSSLSALDEQGARVNVDDIVFNLESKIQELSLDPSQAPLKRQLEGIVEEIYDSGWSSMPISKAEEVKRGFGSRIKNWQNPDTGQANKEAYRAYMGEVEKAAMEKAPELASKFKESKELFGLMAPIEEAASKRAAQLNQSPFGGLGDIASTAAGGGNPVYAAARRAVAPRLASSAAWSADKLADAVRQSPQMFGKYAAPLQAAAARGGNSLAATHFVLEQTDPEYRNQLKQFNGGDE